MNVRLAAETTPVIDCRVPADFVCYRGLLTMLMCTPYEKDEDWIICATKWKGTIFMCARETDRKRLYREQMTDKQKQFMSWGYKFEQYMSSGKRPHKGFMYHRWKKLETNGSGPCHGTRNLSCTWA